MADRDKFKPTSPTIKIRFENERAAELFLSWMSGLGEQDYWEWMKDREEEEEGPITGLRFDYHNPGEGVVTVQCGRLDEE